MMPIQIWTRRNCGEPVPLAARETVWIARDGVVSVGLAPTDAAHAALAIVPFGSTGRVLAGLVVPESLAREARLADAPAASGFHPLEDQAEVRLGSTRVWVARLSGADTAPYAPELHGADVFCARTKARLASGMVIVTCPGLPGIPCGLLFRREAWLPGLPCHGCGFDPGRPAWTPSPSPETPDQGSLHALLARLGGL